MDLQQYIEQIDLYLAEKLSAEAKAAFEQELASNEALQEELADRRIERRAMQAVVKQEYRDKVKAQLPDLAGLADAPNGGTTRSLWQRNYRYMIAIAAAILILLVAIPYIGNVLNPEPELPEIFAEYYSKPARPTALTRSEETPLANRLDSLWQQASRQFTAENYEAVEALLKTIVSSSQEIAQLDQAYFYLGATYQLQERLDEAITAFERVSPRGSYADQAAWYLALTYMIKGDAANCLAVLEGMIQSGKNFKRKEAQKIIELIK